MEHRKQNENYQRIAEQLIDQEPMLQYIKDSRARIIYLESDSARKDGKERLVQGECEKVQSKNQWAISADFTVTLYSKNCVGMSEDQIRVLLFHELLHVGIDQASDGGEVYSIRKHDLEDFKYIIDRFGTNWDSQPVKFCKNAED